MSKSFLRKKSKIEDLLDEIEYKTAWYITRISSM